MKFVTEYRDDILGEQLQDEVLRQKPIHRPDLNDASVSTLSS